MRRTALFLALLIAATSLCLANYARREGRVGYGVSSYSKRSGEATPTIYVDSAAADDSGSGLSAASPKKTLAAAQTLAATTSPARVGLKRGGYWREQFSIPANNVTIMPYGTGAMPVLDGADVATGWTQPNADTYANVWSVSWTRTGPVTTSSELLGLWADGARPRYATSLADLQANGGWYTDSTLAQTTNVYIKSAGNPNSSGVTYEITRRNHGINGHAQILGASRTAQVVTGPIEMKRFVGHYNAYTGGPGTASGLLLRDGNIHHVVTEGAETTDTVAAEMNPASAGIPYTAYRPNGAGFSHTFRRSIALFTAAARRATGTQAFYAHASTPPALDSLTYEGCAVAGLSGFSGVVSAGMTVDDCYVEDAGRYGVELTTNTVVRRLLFVDKTSSPHSGGSRVFRKLDSSTTATVQNSAGYQKSGLAIENASGSPLTITNCSFYSSGQISGGKPALTYSVVITEFRCLAVETGYTGDYNVFLFIGADAMYGTYNGTLRTSLGGWQALTGQDANSVYVREVDQTPGNQHAFWLGVSSGSNAGPAAGDFRINPNARVYGGNNTAYIGTFADGTTPITAAGPQEHYNWNTRAVVAGPPTRYPVLPATVAEMRTYIESPKDWNFYP